VTAPGADLRRLGQLANRFLRPYWRWLALAAVLNVAVGFTLTLRPLVLAPALDAVTTTRAAPATRLRDLDLNNVGPTLGRALGLDPARLLHTALSVSGLFLLLTIVVAGLTALAQVLLASVRTTLQRDLVVGLHAHLLTLPLGFFHRRRAGELVTRLTHDAGRLAASLDSVLRGILQSLAQIGIALAVMLRTDALFAMAILAMGSVHFAITRTLRRRVRRHAELVSDRQADVGARLLESVVGIRAIKSFAAERHDAGKVWTTAEAFRRQSRSARIASEVDVPIRLVADALVAAAVLLLTFHAVAQRRLTLQAAALFFYLSQQLLAPISQVFRHWLGLVQVLGGAARVLELLETRSPMPDGRRTAAPLRDRLVLDHVTFAYERDRPVLRDVSLEIRRGETVAVVGPSGSGKTTLADLVLRLFDPGEGAVRYDGTDVREFTQASYRRHFGVVAQDSLLFNATVRENVVFHRTEDPATLAHAIWAANAEAFVRELPRGLDTVLGDRGVRLSGGQRQRIAIARAVYGHPSILVLDEATSALDSEAEREVQQAIERLGREMTLLVIAHRLSTIVGADRVVVLDRGRVEAAGPHERLLEESPTYRRLYRLQMPAALGSGGAA
jgi:subfamily B ATP-binding cassette protein MsbA